MGGIASRNGVTPQALLDVLTGPMSLTGCWGIWPVVLIETKEVWLQDEGRGSCAPKLSGFLIWYDNSVIRSMAVCMNTYFWPKEFPADYPLRLLEKHQDTKRVIWIG